MTKEETLRDQIAKIMHHSNVYATWSFGDGSLTLQQDSAQLKKENESLKKKIQRLEDEIDRLNGII